jgi:hypothetical protein
MSVVTIVIKDVPGVERIDQWHNELSSILSKLAYEISQTGVPLPETVISRTGAVVGDLEWGPDAFAGVRKAG